MDIVRKIGNNEKNAAQNRKEGKLIGHCETIKNSAQVKKGGKAD